MFPTNLCHITALQVLPMSTLNETICRCPSTSSGNIFASTFYVPPNMIDFNTVWSKFDPSNAAVYGTVIALLVIYVIAAIFLRREDNKDAERVGFIDLLWCFYENFIKIHEHKEGRDIGTKHSFSLCKHEKLIFHATISILKLPSCRHTYWKHRWHCSHKINYTNRNRSLCWSLDLSDLSSND